MGAAAEARRPAPYGVGAGHPPVSRVQRRSPSEAGRRTAPAAARRAAPQPRLMRLFVTFVICVAVLAVGRVSLSFAVVEKTLQTDAIAREERRLSAENARLSEDLAQLGSSVRIQHIAADRLGLQYPAHLEYLKAKKGAGLTRVAARP